MSPSQFEEGKRLLILFGRLVGCLLGGGIVVPETNLGAFGACCRFIFLREKSSSAALILTGQAGVGRTHLLGLVRRWLQNVPPSLFVPIRMDIREQMLWRNLRHHLADGLLCVNPAGHRPIDELLASQADAIPALPERDLRIAIENLRQGKYTRDTAAWLRGQVLPESVLQQGSFTQSALDEKRDATSRNIALFLCGLLHPATVVFCLAEWATLPTHPGDGDGLLAAGQAAALLHDHLPNACLSAVSRHASFQSWRCSSIRPSSSQ